MEIDKLLDNSSIGKKTEKILVRVLNKFPSDIQDFVINNVSFIEARVDKKWNYKNDHIGFCIDATKYSLTFLIVLDSEYYKLSDDHKAHIIAHEIGHAFHKHSSRDINEVLQQKEADDFAKKYGFISSDAELSFDIFKPKFWSFRRFILVFLIILFFLGMVYVEKFEHLLQWVVFM
jgi:hypothetical protein